MPPKRLRSDRQTSRRANHRRLRCEALENRRMLAAGMDPAMDPAAIDNQTNNDVPVLSGEGESAHRIITPIRVTGPHLIPGDGVQTAILFLAEMDSELWVVPVGRSPINARVTLLDENLEVVTDSAAGAALQSDLKSGTQYAMIFDASDEDLEYEVLASEGALAVTGAINTNLFQPEDVDANGVFSPLDALLVINDIARIADGETSFKPHGIYTDVNADGELSASDALQVITLLGVQQEQGENFRPRNFLPDDTETEPESEEVMYDSLMRRIG